MTQHLLCRVGDIGESQAQGFQVGEGAQRRDVVLVCRAGVFRAYVNSCPHQGMPLETFPDKFLSQDGSLLICSTHGARFRVEDGVCVSGPCQGKGLKTIALVVESETISVVLDGA